MRQPSRFKSTSPSSSWPVGRGALSRPPQRACAAGWAPRSARGGGRSPQATGRGVRGAARPPAAGGLIAALARLRVTLRVWASAASTSRAHPRCVARLTLLRSCPSCAQSSSQMEDVENILRNNTTAAAEALLYQRTARSDEELLKRYQVVEAAKLRTKGVPLGEVFERTGVTMAVCSKFWRTALCAP